MEVGERRIGSMRSSKKRSLRKSWWTEDIENAREKRKEWNRKCRK